MRRKMVFLVFRFFLSAVLVCSEHFDLAGLDATWNGSSGDERDDDCAMESDDREDDDDDDIPQLDGASDEKPGKFVFFFSFFLPLINLFFLL